MVPNCEESKWLVLLLFFIGMVLGGVVRIIGEYVWRKH